MVFLTGGTGFIGAHVARALVERGERVRCLVRPRGRRQSLPEGVEIVEGDLDCREQLREALAGCHTLYHCAADYRLVVPSAADMHRSNVQGTANVLEAAARAGVGRVVYTSSVGVLGARADGAPATEAEQGAIGEMCGSYKRSKFLAEEVAREWHQRGLPVVIVNPSTPVGELDAKPTPTGQILVDFLNRRLPAYVDTGLNVVDVRDVAAGHVLAAERGRPGERYILGHRNVTLRALLEQLAALTGLAAPRVRLPHWIPLTIAVLEAPFARLRRPRVPLDGVRMSRRPMYFDAGKAVRELGLPQSAIEGALARAVAWYRTEGYVR
jgi:dihydroflavonol-4-reductase